MKGIFLLLAVLGTISLAGLAISIAEGSILGGIASTVFLLLFMGIGFSKKKKIQEKETV